MLRLSLQKQYTEICVHINDLVNHPEMYGTIEDVETTFLTVLCVGKNCQILQFKDDRENSIFMEWGKFVASKIKKANPHTRYKFSSYKELVSLIKEFTNFFEMYIAISD